jgi:hypothetical protein
MEQAPRPNPQQQLRFPLDAFTIELLRQALGLDSSSAAASINGRSHNPTTTTIPINSGGTPQLLDFATNDFANGVTWGSSEFTCVTAGIYLVTCVVNYLATHMQDGVGYAAIIKKNSTIIATSEDQAGVSSSNPLSPCVTDLVSLSVGDTISFYCQTESNSVMTISGASGAICKV